MIIVSQDKNIVVNFDNIAHIFINKGSETTICYGRMSGCSETLGYYATEKRAKEVLQEIIQCYRDTNYEYETCWCLRNMVYEMPEE